MGVFEYDGLYSVFALTWMTLGLVSLILAALGYLRIFRLPIEAPAEGMMLLGLLFYLYIATFKMPSDFIDLGRYTYWFYRVQTFLIATLCITYFFLPRQPKWLTHGLLVIGIVLAIILRIGILGASPSPQIDVYTAGTHAAEAWIEDGKSPYVSDETDIVPLHYPPLNAYLQAVSFMTAGDIRAVYILAEIVFALFLWLIARKTKGDLYGLFVVSLFLFHPRGIYMIDMAWTEPPILAFMGAAVFLQIKGWEKSAAVAYGLMLSLKQYLLFFLVHWFLLSRKWPRLAIMLGAAIVTIIPFLIIDPQNMIQNGFLQTLGGGVREDSLTFVTFIMNVTGIVLPRVTSLLVGAVVSGITFWAFRRAQPVLGFLFSAAITTFCLFLFGAQAFANYYYVVTGIVLLLLAVHPVEE